MSRIAIANVNRECQCGAPATAGRYCHECDGNVREMIDNYNGRIVTGQRYDKPTTGTALRSNIRSVRGVATWLERDGGQA